MNKVSVSETYPKWKNQFKKKHTHTNQIQYFCDVRLRFTNVPEIILDFTL